MDTKGRGVADWRWEPCRVAADSAKAKSGKEKEEEKKTLPPAKQSNWTVDQITRGNMRVERMEEEEGRLCVTSTHNSSILYLLLLFVIHCHLQPDCLHS